MASVPSVPTVQRPFTLQAVDHACRCIVCGGDGFRAVVGFAVASRDEPVERAIVPRRQSSFAGFSDKRRFRSAVGQCASFRPTLNPTPRYNIAQSEVGSEAEFSGYGDTAGPISSMCVPRIA